MKALFQIRAYDYMIFLLIFIVVLPVGHLLDLIPINTISLWGRYFCFAIAAIGLDILWGYTGILCMCQALFFCMGGYGIAMYMTLLQSKGEIPQFLQWNQMTELPGFWMPFNSFPLTAILCLLVPAIFAAIFGYFIFKSRIRGVYFAIITQALALALWLVFLRNETFRFRACHRKQRRIKSKRRANADSLDKKLSNSRRRKRESFYLDHRGRVRYAK